MAPKTSEPACTNCSTSGTMEVVSMTAPSASCGAVAAADTGLALRHGELHELVAQDGGAVDGGADVGGDAHAAVEGSVTLALSPSRAMPLTEPTGTSASCTCAPLVRSPTSLKTAVAVRCAEPPDTEQPVRPRASAEGGQCRQGDAPGGASEPARHVVQPAGEQAPVRRVRGARPCPWSWGSGGSNAAAGAVRVGVADAVSASVTVARRLTAVRGRRDVVGQQARPVRRRTRARTPIEPRSRAGTARQ